MNPISNFIPISRKLFKHGFWLEDRVYSRFEAWLDMLALARYENRAFTPVINNQLVTYNSGQLAASLRFLGERWGWSVTKVKKFLDVLIAEGMIKTVTAEGTRQTIITICNYDVYNPLLKNTEQQKKQWDNSEVTVEEQRDNKTNKENKEEKSKESNIYRAFAHLCLSHAEFKKLTNTGYTPQQIDFVLDAIENYSGNKKYRSLFLTAKNWLS